MQRSVRFLKSLKPKNTFQSLTKVIRVRNFLTLRLVPHLSRWHKTSACRTPVPLPPDRAHLPVQRAVASVQIQVVSVFVTGYFRVWTWNATFSLLLIYEGMVKVRVIHPESRAMNPWTTSERINSVILLMPDPLQPLQRWNTDAIHNCDTSGKSPCDNFSPRPMASKAGLGSNSPIMSNPWILNSIFETEITKTLLWKKQDGIPVACVGLCDDLGQMIFWPNTWQKCTKVQQLSTIIFIKFMMTTTLTIDIWRLT